MGTEPAPATLEFTVAAADTAAALGSGSVPVLGTPRLVAWAEAATVRACEPLTTEDTTTVGTRVDLEHLRATPVGRRVRVTAEVVERSGIAVRLSVVAEHLEPAALGRPHAWVIIGRGEVTRAVVDRERFVARASRE